MPGVNKTGTPQGVQPPSAQPARQRHILDPRSWGARLVSLVTRSRRQTPTTQSAQTPTTKARPLEKRDIQQVITAPEIAQRLLEKRQEQDRPGSVQEPTGESLKKGKMTKFSDLSSGTYGVTDTAFPGQAGPILVRKVASKAIGASSLLNGEAKILKGLSHPNIIESSPELSSRGRLLMEHGGTTLTQSIQADMQSVTSLTAFQRLEPSKRTAFLKKDRMHRKARFESSATQILKGLAYLKKQNVVHKDIKPDNILINPGNGQVRIADFGLAEKLGDNGTTKDCSGSPAYMAPEIFALSAGERKAGYGPEVDMYSAGCVMYEMLTGGIFAAHPVMRHQKYSSDELRRTLAQEINPTTIPMLTKADAHRMVTMLAGMLERDPQQRLTPSEAMFVLATGKRPNREASPRPSQQEAEPEGTMARGLRWLKNVFNGS
ncbi:serine/threonine-protein kinase [Parendozoicomonas haliclonae]|uniref:Serine/threonine-protein kinase PknJ n=1 Tax=Parendozoicomonas haliclonae TaxID=1960125 RepID=A0A1X7AFE7_9GAMM|nr:serine/threonine-protein kinase [Parendozoicomonas haliclonae]SMA37450.1 Serine/threonine-protein kinase PknJ [Parendozoicomonas haliclonae]